jgi:hypothetical protein
VRGSTLLRPGDARWFVRAWIVGFVLAIFVIG